MGTCAKYREQVQVCTSRYQGRKCQMTEQRAPHVKHQRRKRKLDQVIIRLEHQRRKRSSLGLQRSLATLPQTWEAFSTGGVLGGNTSGT